MRTIFSAFFGFFLSISMYCQQTVGTFLNLESSFNGYTLLFPSASTETYLIDNCGQIVNQWSSNFQPGVVAYLLENGNLLRTARIQGAFSGGGVGGRIEMYSWEGTLIWSYNHASSTFHQHHDIEFLPNGNILILAWELKTSSEAIEQGRNPNAINPAGLWPEQIIEIKPTGSDGAEIVWEWYTWDHLVQDFDPDKPNYAVISDHPELLDLNIFAGAGGGTSSDWMHVNSINYNPVLDQIVINSRTMNEFFIIDHSTTTEEAAGHTGGNFGKGGDFLYRWGNPLQYGRGTSNDQKLFGQHDAHWIPYDLPGGGGMMLFNNGSGRPEGSFSTVDVIELPIKKDGTYALEDGLAYIPESAFWSFKANPPNSLFANRVSGAQRMPNGNTLICEGPEGHIFEIDENLATVWTYINPVTQNGPVSQESSPGNNSLFRAYRYAPDYPAFQDKDLIPQGFVELNPVDYGCQIFSATSVVFNETNLLVDVFLKSNPVDEFLQVKNENILEIDIEIHDLNGKKLYIQSSKSQIIDVHVGNLSPGLYILSLFDKVNQKKRIEKFVKL